LTTRKSALLPLQAPIAAAPGLGNRMHTAPISLRVIGLDSGTRHFGWGIVEKHGSKLVHIAHGTISPSDKLPLGERLVRIEAELVAALAVHTPQAASMESLFFAKDPQSMVKLGHARGVGMLVCARAGLPVFEYAPTRIKLAATGSGRADKLQVAQMMRMVLGLLEPPQADAADALAAALTHIQQSSFTARAVPVLARQPLPKALPRALAVDAKSAK
jgi:crossover junction endodeoxyribonuclease RuvC